jgi:cellulose synthase operon protein C
MARFRVALLLLAIAGCASPKPIPLEVEYAGCKAVLMPGTICVLDSNRKLEVWVGAPPDARIEIGFDGEEIDAAGKPVQNGQRFSLTAPTETREMSVLVASREGQASWSLSLMNPIQQARQAASRDALREVDDKTLSVYHQIQKRNLPAARETLSSLRLPSEAPAESRYLVSYYQGLLAEKEGDYRKALSEVRKAVEIAERVNLAHYQWLAEEKLALLLRGVGRSRASAHLFERLRRTPQAWDSCEKAQFLNNQAWSALLAREAGESLEDPTPLLEAALEAYGSCKNARIKQVGNTLLNLALAHLQERRLPQAKDLLARAHRLEPHPPLSEILWRLDLEARIELLEGRPTEALRLFEELAELAQVASSPDGRLRAAFGQAQSYQALENPAAALETLRMAENLLDEQSLQVPVQEGRETFAATRQALVGLHLEILLEQDRKAEALGVARHSRSRMLRQLERSDSLAGLTPEQRERWDRLLAAYQEKRASLEERASSDWKLAANQLSREQAAREVEAEATKKFLDEAFQVLESPGERTEEEQPPLRPGELTLTYHPLRHGWIGFAADGKTPVRVHRFELPPDFLSRPEELSRRLLLPFRDSIERTKRIRILASGPLREVDFHALPFAGDVLLAKAPVVYGLDLPVSTAPVSAQGRQALLVADPRDDLQGARDEAGLVRKVLRSASQPWIIEELKSAKASAKAVHARLPAADLLHYAGHGSFSGFGGWESSLLLADETRLTLGDLLALERVPPWVVLSACDTGLSSTEIPIESLGLAHAFLLAGSRGVVASVRPAKDSEVPAFFPELYREWDRGQDLAVALQRAQLSWRKRNPRADWKSFRLFEP